MRYKPQIIDIPLPSMGGKCWLLEAKGMFVLEPGPGTMRTFACTHAGSGTVEFIDGIPNELGFFPDDDMPEPPAFTEDELQILEVSHRTTFDPPAGIKEKMDLHKAWGARRGRSFYRASPAVMGSWMLDAGFIHGLTVRATGEHSSVNTMGSIVWMPFKARTK
ncbi:MAG TPA: hypothetical protein VL614_15015 [Acetobacteraceae bacterium]|jgi:hypothetical protein|nr:hypothetical protein [Acetobacteraceae bacterium]